jgi:hypothetical protein
LIGAATADDANASPPKHAAKREAREFNILSPRKDTQRLAREVPAVSVNEILTRRLQYARKSLKRIFVAIGERAGFSDFANFINLLFALVYAWFAVSA